MKTELIMTGAVERTLEVEAMEEKTESIRKVGEATTIGMKGSASEVKEEGVNVTESGSELELLTIEVAGGGSSGIKS